MAAVKKQNPAAEKEGENFHVMPKDAGKPATGSNATPSENLAAQSDIFGRDPDAGTLSTDPSGQVNQPSSNRQGDRSQVS